MEQIFWVLFYTQLIIGKLSNTKHKKKHHPKQETYFK